jgi:hypothetical protein
MSQPMANISQTGETSDSSALIQSLANTNLPANLPPEVELVMVRQMMETLFARVDSLQQNQAMQLAGVHDRLDAVELELPLIQEQGALRIRDLEARMSVEIDAAARSAVEEATAAVTAVLQEEVVGKFTSLAAQMEAQNKELSQMRESKKLADTRLNRAILDIERLCGNLSPQPHQVPQRPHIEPATSPFRSRVAEHIRKAAVDFAPGEDNPLIGDPHSKKPGTESAPTNPSVAARTPLTLPVAQPALIPDSLPSATARAATAETGVPRTLAPSTAAGEKAVPGFEAWKRQFMDGDPLGPSLSPEPENSGGTVFCPQCYSDRTRPATLNRLDILFRLAKYTPHRCRSCSHRFYKRGKAGPNGLTDDGQPESRSRAAMETR